MIKHIWEGIYNSFDECPKCDRGFESDRWVCQETNKINRLLEATKDNKTIPSVISCQMSLLPFLAALVSVNSKGGKVSILDFGGGLGSGYISVVAGCTSRDAVDYHIVDTKNICRAGKSYYKDDRQIHYYDCLPKEIQSVDIVHLCSSLQYIEDWKGLLYDIAAYNPQYILLVDVPAGDIPTYATVQNYYESKIPYWFFNVNDIISTMSSTNYTLLFNSSYAGTYLGKQQPMPQDNFPEEYRVGKSCNLLFNRKEK